MTLRDKKVFFILKETMGMAWWWMLVIPALKRLRQARRSQAQTQPGLHRERLHLSRESEGERKRGRESKQERATV